MLISDILSAGRIMRGRIGVNAVNNGDLLQLNSSGQLYPSATTDFAAVANIGASIVANTTVNSTSIPNYGISGSTVKVAAFSAVDGATFIAGTNAASNFGLKIYKYGSNGALQGSVTIDSASATLTWPNIVQLSNGNLAVTWATSGNQQYAVIDRFLNIVKAATSVGTATGNDQSDIIALSGGGFALVFQPAAGPSLGIYSNTGTVVAAQATVSGTPSTSAMAMLAQLSSGNVMLAISSTAASQALGYAIYSAAGSLVTGYTNVNATTLSGATQPKISAMAASAFVAMEILTATPSTVTYVLNNSGAQQGTALTNVNGVAINQLTNDGSVFWLLQAQAGATSGITALPTTGAAGAITTALTASLANGAQLIAERGLLISMPAGGGSGVCNIYQPSAPGVASFVNLIGTSNPSTGASTTGYAAAVGDHAILFVGIGTSEIFSIFKYINASIVGVSQQTFAAGQTPGTLTTYNHGGAAGRNGFPTTAMAGTLGKAFDHSASNIIGNKGTLLGNSCALEGIV